MFYKVDFDILNNVLDYIEEGNIKRKEYIYQILEKMLEYFTEGEYNSRELKLYISIKRVREIIDIYSLEYKFSKEQINKIQYYIDKLQKELIFKNLSNIKILLEIFYKDYVDLSGNEKDKIWEKIMV